MDQVQIQAIITDATGTHDPATVAALEAYIRNEIFHSTLGWIDEELLRRAALRAQDVFQGRQATGFLCIEYVESKGRITFGSRTRYLLTNGTFADPTLGDPEQSPIALFPNAKIAIEEGSKASNRRAEGVISAFDKNAEIPVH